MRLRSGDVVTYTPDRGRSIEREGFAIHRPSGTFDTFWGVGHERGHRLTADELKTATLVGNLNDFRTAQLTDLKITNPRRLMVIPSQHGAVRLSFVRIRDREHLADEAQAS